MIIIRHLFLNATVIWFIYSDLVLEMSILIKYSFWGFLESPEFESVVWYQLEGLQLWEKLQLCCSFEFLNSLQWIFKQLLEEP